MRHLMTAMEHTLWAIVRRKRTLLTVAVAFAPLILPVALRFFPGANMMDVGDQIESQGDAAFSIMVELFYIRTMAPLMALFFRYVADQ